MNNRIFLGLLCMLPAHTVSYTSCMDRLDRNSKNNSEYGGPYHQSLIDEAQQLEELITLCNRAKELGIPEGFNVVCQESESYNQALQRIIQEKKLAQDKKYEKE